ncbi:MAG: ATP-binding protein [Thermodesulfobacteriota bacterium]
MTPQPSPATAMQLEFDLEGMIDIFGRAVFSSPLAVVRELIQNAHDACIARQNQDPIREDQDKILLSYHGFQSLLIVCDTGCGMTLDELKNQFSLLGRSEKANLRQRLMKADYQNVRTIIGEFGIGLLAALAVSKEVIVDTHAIADRSRGIRWSYRRGDRAARTEYIAPEEPGTKIMVSIADKHAQDFSESAIREAARHFAALLPVPIEVNNERINPDLQLWNQPDRATDEQWKKYIEKRTGNEPMQVLRLCEQRPDLNLTGVLFIPRRQRLTVHGQIDVYVRRMFVCVDRGDLLPRWASAFIRGYINSNTMQRTVSGESLAQDEAYKKAKEYIAREVATMIGRFVGEGRVEDSCVIVQQFDNEIKRGAIESDFLWQRVWDKLLFRVGDELKTIPEYLDKCRAVKPGSNTIYYYEDEGDHAHATVIKSSTGTPIVNAVYGVDSLCLKCWERGYAIDDAEAEARHRAQQEAESKNKNKHDRDGAEQVEKKKVATLAELASERFAKVEDPKWRRLSDLYRLHEIDCEPRAFEPAEIPAVLVRAEGFTENLTKLVSALRETDLGEDFLNMILSRARGGRNPGTTLFMNTNNPEMKMVADLAPSDPVLEHVLLAIYNNAFMFTHRSLSETEVGRILGTNNQIVKLLLEQRAKSPQSGPAKVATEPVQEDSLIIFTDLEASTWLLAHIQLESHASVFLGYVKALEDVAKKNQGVFSKFTGDGALIFFRAKDRAPVAQAAIQCAREIPIVTANYFNSNPVSTILERNNLTPPRCRTALAAGRIWVVSVGSAPDIIGRSVVQAQRLCEKKDLFSTPTTVLATFPVAQWAQLGPRSYKTTDEMLSYPGGSPVEIIQL